MTLLRCKQHTLDLVRPQIMGILNVTPDSFSDGGQCYSHGSLHLDLALRRAEAMIAAGADIIDVGGESTRPGAEPVSSAEELERVVPVVAALSANFDVVISVDTSCPTVMTESVAAGAGIINDVRALQRPGALAAAAQSGAAVCLMHMQGEPEYMQSGPRYDDVVGDVISFLKSRIDAAVAAGIAREQLIVDPGYGFGKTLEHNFLLLKRQAELKQLGCPILAGLSRKSMIKQLLGRAVDERLPGSLALALLAVQQGANIVRVHDVAETVDVLRIFAAVATEPQKL